MKIALVKRRYSLKAGGSERYCVMMARGLMEAGHEVTVIGHVLDDELKNDVRFVQVPISKWTSSTKNRSFAINCRSAIAAGQFDVTYALGRAFGVDAVRITERLQSHWLNVYYSAGFWRTVQSLNPRHRTLIELERQLYTAHSTRRIVTQSKLDRDLVKRYYGIDDSKITTIYNGIDASLFHEGFRSERHQVRERFGIPQQARLMIFASMDFEGKGLRTILQSMAACRGIEPHLLVLGTGPIAKFSTLARNLGVERQVVFAGRQSHIAACYGAGDVFILPTEYEPFPNVNLEAMACGLPVITTATSGGADILQDSKNGFLISHRNALEEMTDVITRYFSITQSQQETMSRNAVGTAQKFPISATIHKTIEMLMEVADEKQQQLPVASRRRAA